MYHLGLMRMAREGPWALLCLLPRNARDRWQGASARSWGPPGRCGKQQRVSVQPQSVRAHSPQTFLRAQPSAAFRAFTHRPGPLPRYRGPGRAQAGYLCMATSESWARRGALRLTSISSPMQASRRANMSLQGAHIGVGVWLCCGSHMYLDPPSQWIVCGWEWPRG